MLLPVQENYRTMRGAITIDPKSSANCISQCRGCQCNGSPISAKAAFEQTFLTPSQAQFDSLRGNINAELTASAKCNCTSCNSCRCDCSCRTHNEESASAIWA
jgi:Cys-rich radical ribosomally synthesized peptide